MASKKQTKKERREEIRQARIEAQRRRMRTKRRRRYLTLALIVLVAGAGTAFGVSRYQESRKTLAYARKVAGCTGIKKLTAMESPHLELLAQQGLTPEPYNSKPPTSGPHSGQPPPGWGSYAETLGPERYVHSLEHGGIVIHYKGISEADGARISDFADSYTGGVLAMPDKDIDGNVVITAWARIETCKKLELRVLTDWVRGQCHKGPETTDPAVTCVKGSA